MMTKNTVRMIENDHKWTNKFFKQSDLDKMGRGHTDSDANGRRATKEDIQKVTQRVAKLRNEF